MQEATQQTVIRIGHPSYSAPNNAKYCFSKASAVRELHSRGVKRDVARAKVNAVCSKFGGYATISDKGFSVIEVGNYTGDYHPF